MATIRKSRGRTNLVDGPVRYISRDDLSGAVRVSIAQGDSDTFVSVTFDAAEWARLVRLFPVKG